MLSHHQYKERVLSLSYGKKFNNVIYVHVDFLKSDDPILDSFITKIVQAAPISHNYNVTKFLLTEFRISFLHYPNFFKVPHPELKTAVTINLSTGKIRSFDYSSSENGSITCFSTIIYEIN